MSTIAHCTVPPALPPGNAKEPEENLSEFQQNAATSILAHFSRDEYSLTDGGEGALTEEERFWLVGRVPVGCCPMLTRDILSLMNVSLGLPILRNVLICALTYASGIFGHRNGWKGLQYLVWRIR
jgi:hypothetical protein